VAASDLDEDKYTSKVAEVLNVSSYDLVTLQSIQTILLFLQTLQLFRIKDQLPRRKVATRNYRSEVLICFEKLICRASCPPNRNNMISLAPA